MTQCMPSVSLVTCVTLLLLVSSDVMQRVSSKPPMRPSRMVRQMLHKRGFLRLVGPEVKPEVSTDHLRVWFLCC